MANLNYGEHGSRAYIGGSGGSDLSGVQGHKPTVSELGSGNEAPLNW